MKNYTNFKHFFILTVIFSFLSSINMFSQTWPVLTDERGDSISYTWPIPLDSLCNKSEIIIYFKPEALNLNKLCWNLPDPALAKTLIYNNSLAQYHSYLYSQEFPIDTLIADINLSNTIKAFGGIYFKRISTASPCRDTLSLTRYGDTVFNRTYLMLLLKLNNDSTIINACTYLTYLYQDFLDFAEPNFCAKNNNFPSDSYYEDQENLTSEYIDAERAWDYQTGSPFIKVAVIDDGIFYNHCDLKGKVEERYNYVMADPLNDDPKEISFDDSFHGTNMCGLIGSYTNRINGEGCINSGIAGIAGGWDDLLIDNIGCPIVGLRAGKSKSGVPPYHDTYYNASTVASAIIAAASENVDEDNDINQAFGVHIINLSNGFKEYFFTLQQAINYAYENGVSVIAARGNANNETDEYPATSNSQWVTSVGGLEDNHTRDLGSKYGQNLDFLAPGSSDINIFTTEIDNDYVNTFGTSAAAAHVSGAMALLRSEFYEHPNLCNGKPEPEDFENMLKAACLDLNYDDDNLVESQKTRIGYDNVSGWGEVKIGKLLDMLNSGYTLEHISIPYESLDIPFQEFGEIKDLYVLNGINPKRTDIEPNLYYSRVREILGRCELNDNWNRTNREPLFVWGRNGRTNKGGFSKSSYFFLTSYTEVINGEKGNVDENGKTLAEGIYHNNSFNELTGKIEIIAKTYQYEIFDFSDHNEKITNLPVDENLELYISVFGKSKELSISELKNKDILYPNPAVDYFQLDDSFSDYQNFQINVIDLFGNIVLSKKIEQIEFINDRLTINVKNLSSGFYFVEVKSSFKTNFYKLIVSK